jgi:hypothetical protein
MLPAEALDPLNKALVGLGVEPGARIGADRIGGRRRRRRSRSATGRLVAHRPSP